MQHIYDNRNIKMFNVCSAYRKSIFDTNLDGILNESGRMGENWRKKIKHNKEKFTQKTDVIHCPSTWSHYFFKRHSRINDQQTLLVRYYFSVN